MLNNIFYFVYFATIVALSGAKVLLFFGMSKRM